MTGWKRKAKPDRLNPQTKNFRHSKRRYKRQSVRYRRRMVELAVSNNYECITKVLVGGIGSIRNKAFRVYRLYSFTTLRQLISW